ncbi:MAG: hypothetical protein EZS28_034578 [Streblomastix strix]|uniref:Uncharacterized protein n=1 Tax=Streblomastix strix TaxID=222440 RepID=A0A5J4UJR7_9EUKA|nr:MAG: hypothetical protein EZS28_034578 [Streblomastix strix]
MMFQAASNLKQDRTVMNREDIGIGIQFGELADKGLDNEDGYIYDQIVDGTSAHVDKLDIEIEALNKGEYDYEVGEDYYYLLFNGVLRKGDESPDRGDENEEF